MVHVALFSYSIWVVGRGTNVLEKAAQVVRCNNHARACQAAHSLPRASIIPNVVTCLTNLSSGGEALTSLSRQSRLWDAITMPGPARQPTHFPEPQSAPTVVTCSPRNAVLIRFTYEIIIRFTTLLNTYYVGRNIRPPWLQDHCRPERLDPPLHHA